MLSLFEKVDAAREGNSSYDEDIRKAFNAQLKVDRVNIFKEYVYYAFPEEKGFEHAQAVEFFLWLKTLNVTI